MILRLIFIVALFSGINSVTADQYSTPTHKLDGTNISYNYSSGRSYHVKFEDSGVSYRFLTGSDQKKWWGPFPYKAFETEKDVFMAAWHEKEYGDYVTLLINFKTNLLFGSALISGDQVHFYDAKIVSHLSNKELKQ